MRKAIIYISLTLFIIGCTTNDYHKKIQRINQRIQPQDIKTNYYDTIIVDEFRQLEDLNDTNVLIWLKDQGEYAESVLSRLSGREKLLDLMRKYNNRKKYHFDKIKRTKNNQYFYLKRKSEEEVFKLYYRNGLEQKEELILSPTDITLDNCNSFVINNFSPDWEGNKIAIALTSKGNDRLQIVIYDLTKRTILPQVIKNCFNAANQVAYWLPNNKAFLYLAYNPMADNVLLHTKTMCYTVGEDPENAIDVFSKTSCSKLDINAEDFPNVIFDDQNNEYLIGLVSGPNSFDDAYYLELGDFYNGLLNWKPLYKKEHKVIRGSFKDDEFYYISAKNASNKFLLKVNINNLNFDNPELIITEKAEEVIQDFKITSEGLYFSTTKNGVEAKLYSSKDKEEKNIKLPNTFGRLFLDNISYSEPELWVTATGWLTDMQRMRLEPNTNTFTEENLGFIAHFPEFDHFKVEELIVESYDGALVPLSVISRKGIKKTGHNPTLLYGYGAYGIPWRPYFLPDWLTWVEEGGILCFSHIRGGGEKGDLWHKMGKNHNKPNSWKDFIACSEYLIEQKYTSNKNLAIYGGSAGGIVIGRSMTERPDLYAAVISEVGMLNAIRFENMPGGLNHAKEFGYLNIQEDCMDLIEMDAYLHIEKGKEYPPFLGVIGMNDLRVSPWQTAKFIAKLQQNASSENKALMIVDFEEGHYFNSTQSKSMEKLASIFSFASHQINHKSNNE